MDKNKVLAYLIINKLVPNISTTIDQIKTGAASYNYVIKNREGYTFCKILRKEKNCEIYPLVSNLIAFDSSRFSPKILSPVFKINGMNGVLLEYKKGKPLNALRFTRRSCQELVNAYKIFNISPDKLEPYLLPSLDLRGVRNTVAQRFEQKKFTFLTQVFANKIVKFLRGISNHSLMVEENNIQVIHGDLHAKNLLFEENNFSSFLDFEEIRMGCQTEDWCRLLLCTTERIPLPFCRKYFLHKQFKYFRELLHFSHEEWNLGCYSFLLLKLFKLTTNPKNMNLWNLLKFIVFLKLINIEILNKKFT